MRYLSVGLLIFVVLLTVAISAQNPESKIPPKTINQTDKGVAIDGYDTVAYFTDTKPVKGQSKYTYEWNGARWWFANMEHQRLFAAAPQMYAPQYGGYCSMSMSKGKTLSTDPAAWKIISGKLYFVHNKSVLPQWEAQADENIEKANFFWPKLYK